MRTTNPLYIRGVDAFDQPFSGDLFERRALAERLTGYVNRLPDGGVFAIDAAWGEGKTWFGRHWCESLKSNHATAYLDAFATDHTEDPFLPICAEILRVIRERDAGLASTLRASSGKVARALLPMAAKVALTLGGKVVLGSSSIQDDWQEAIQAVDAKLGEAAEKYLDRQLAAYEEEARSVVAFKAKLEQFTGTLERPFIVFVDELDRCRPDYAVKTIERIKHFFGVKGLVFVLLINRVQLTAAVKGLYGEHVDADSYLRKFVQFSLTLPKRSRGVDDNEQFCSHRLNSLGFSGGDSSTLFASVLGSFATAMGLSLRDVELGTVYFAMAQPIGNSSSVLAWAVALKLSRPDIFMGILRRDPKAHAKARELLAGLRIEKLSWFSTAISEMHALGAAGFPSDGKLSSDTWHLARQQWGGKSPETLFAWVFAKIDLAVDQ